jgi:ABC-type lipoprotein release transport system permease subunit
LLLLVVLVIVGKVPLSYNLRNLLVRWRITFLTALAFTLVVSLLTMMLAFVNGMTRLTEASGQPGNVMVLSEGATDELFSNLAFSDTNNVERRERVLKDEQDRPLCSKEVYIVVNQPVPPQEGGTTALSAKGKIKSTVSGSSGFILATDEGADLTFRMVPEGKVYANNQVGSLERLKIDDQVWVAYENKGGELVATEVRGSNRRRFTQVRGIEDPIISSRVHEMELFPGGKWFSEAGVQELPAKQRAKTVEQAVQVVLGEGVARILGQDQNKERLEVGDIFQLGPRKWIVTGIMRSAGSTFGSEVWAKRSIVGPMFGKDQITCLVVRTADATSASALADDLSKNFKPAVRAEPEIVYYSKLSETNKQFLFAIVFVTIIMAIGGVFGVMNTMFAAISQRTKDIGVMRILGFARWQVLVSFFLETLAIALVGGLLGCALGYLCDGWTATSIISSGGGGGGKTVVLKLAVDANTLAVGLLFTLVMGALGGLVPSLSAMRLRPLESLR